MKTMTKREMNERHRGHYKGGKFAVLHPDGTYLADGRSMPEVTIKASMAAIQHGKVRPGVCRERIFDFIEVKD